MGAKLIAAMLADQRLSPIRLEKSRLLSERACIRAICGVHFRQLGICGRLHPKLLKSQNVVDLIYEGWQQQFETLAQFQTAGQAALTKSECGYFVALIGLLRSF